MATTPLFWTVCLSVLLLSSSQVSARFFHHEGETYTVHEEPADTPATTHQEPTQTEYESTPTYEEPAHEGKIQVKRPAGTYYKTILSTDGGGIRSLLSVMVVIEIENAIKRYIVANPSYFPEAHAVTSIDDIDISLADYFDCMTGISAGSWTALYLASRGGQGAAAVVFEDPEIIEQYGVIKPGSAEGLRVLFREYGTVIYPPEAINTTAGEIGDLTNPLAPGVAAPVYPIEGLEETLTAFLGTTTLADLDTSVLVTTFDLLTGYTTIFTQNRFHDTPRTSFGRLIPRVGPKTTFTPDLVFEDADFFLVDIGAGGGSPPTFQPAVPTTAVNDESMEFLLVDGGIPVEDAVVPTSFYVAAENDLFDFERIAVVSIGSGRVQTDYTPFANAGLAGWLDGFTLLALYSTSGRQSQVSLLDYVFYANAATEPHQYLRVQTSVDAGTDLAVAYSVIDQPAFIDVYEEAGVATAQLYQEAIETFVKSFIFG